MAHAKIDFNTLIFNLFNEKRSITLTDILTAANLTDTPSNRRTIQRVLKSLIAQALIQAKGSARARVYILKDERSEESQSVELPHTELFKSVILSQESQKLLAYLLNPIHARSSAKYNQAFLDSYEPNKTFYLSAPLRETLAKVGSAENIARPAGTYARNILNRLLIDISWNSSRLEGNTYSLLETKRLIELGESAAGKDAASAQMILNHKEAVEYIVESVEETKVSSLEICSIHALLSDNLLGNPSASGCLRKIAVGISGTTYLPLDNPHMLQENFDIFIKKMNLISDPFEQSFFSLVQLSYMQAFEDVNKRTARLAANIPLIKKNLKPLSFIDVNQKDYVTALLGIYEKNNVSLLRDLYVWAYYRSSQHYSAVQQTVSEPNLFKLKHREIIHRIVRAIVLENVTGQNIVQKIRALISELNFSDQDASQLFQIIETEIISLHEGNVARFKIRPSEYQKWKNNEK